MRLSTLFSAALAASASIALAIPHHANHWRREDLLLAEPFNLDSLDVKIGRRQDAGDPNAIVSLPIAMFS